LASSRAFHDPTEPIMRIRIFRLLCGLTTAAVCGFVFFFYSEMASIKLHPAGVTDRLQNMAGFIAWDPTVLVILLPAAFGLFWGIAFSVKTFFRLSEPKAAGPDANS
jgi:hypothetical protein